MGRESLVDHVIDALLDDIVAGRLVPGESLPAEADLAARYRAGGMGYGTAKKELADLFEAHFAPMRAKRAELAANPSYVEDVLQAGAAKARKLAAETVRKARRAVGLE